MIVGIVGKARSGKDTAANFLGGRNFKRIAFADPLKEGLKCMMGWTDEHVYGDLKEVVCPYWGFTPRWALQFVGTELFRNHIRNDFWIHRANKDVVDNPGQDFVFSDVRFMNEANYIKGVGLLIRLSREGAQASGGIAGHDSETEMDKIKEQVEIYNDGSLEDLRKAINNAVSGFYGW